MPTMASFHSMASSIKITTSALLWLIFSTAEAWRSGGLTPLQHRQPHHRNAFSTRDNNSFGRDAVVMFHSRREFLSQTSNAVASAMLSNIILSAPPAYADDSQTQQQQQQQQQQQLQEKEKEILKDVVKEAIEEDIIIKDTKNLITELEEQVKAEEEADPSSPSTTDEGADTSADAKEEQLAETTKSLIDNLEKEEEEIKSETESLIDKIETLEPQLLEPEAESFVNKLKTRVEEKEDLIEKLKKQSEKDVDPKTGKFRYMTKKQFKERAPSDFDFMKALKDTVLNDEEFERDLEAFEGLLETKFGPLMKELDKDFGELSKTAGPLAEELGRDVAPVLEKGMEEVKKSTEPFMGDVLNEVKKAGGDVVDSILNPPFKVF